MNKPNLGGTKEFFKKLMLALIWVVIGGAIVFGTMTYLWLKADNDRLEAQRDQLIIEKIHLQRRLEEVRTEGELLKEKPLR